jgi:hypothetical protein
VVNKSLGNLSRSLVTEQGHQRDHILAREEFAFNNSVNRSTGNIPFEIVYGGQPRGVAKLRELNQDEFRSARDISTEMKRLHNQVRR